MKRMFFFLIFAATTACCFSQNISNIVSAPTVSTENNTFSKNAYTAGKYGPDRDADFYLHRSKSQRTVGWVTLGGGLLLSGIGLLLINGDVTTSNSNESTAAVLFITGAASGIASIPFMIMASANRHKAKLLMAKQKTGFGAPPNAGKYITGITMTIPFGK